MRNSAQVPGFQSHTLFKTETKKKGLEKQFSVQMTLQAHRFKEKGPK